VPEYSPRRMLVTGGAGFIGCNFVRYILSADRDICLINLDALTYAGSPGNLIGLPDAGRHVVFVKGDITDRPLVDSLLRENRVDTVVHFAAESHVDRSITGPGAFVQTNIVGTYTLLEAARCYWLESRHASHSAPGGHFRFHHISTDEVYGSLSPEASAFTEATPYAPNSPYSASKAGADHLVRAYYHTYGLPVTVSNCSNNYGPYQHTEKFIPTVIRSCIERKPIPVYGDGSNVRDWLYVEDHCRGIADILYKGRVGETYNIGGCNEWANIDIAKYICTLMDEHLPDGRPHAGLIEFVKDRPGHDWRYAINSNKIRHALSWQPAESFETGIRKTVEWYLKGIVA